MKKSNISIPKALLIIDVQKSAVGDSLLPPKIEKLQESYDFVFISRFVNEESPLLVPLNWNGYADTSLSFTPKKGAFIFNKNIYSSFITEMCRFKEIHICGFDTDACVYKTAMDLIEHGIRPIILKDFCGTQTAELQEAALLLIRRNIGENNIK